MNNPLERLRVLYVEDEEKIAQLMQEALQRHFQSFWRAADGEEGLRIFYRERPDLVITDITMPGMDGLAMSRTIHEDAPDTPIVVVSAYSDKEKLLGAIDAGIVKYFIKPFDPEELLEFLESLVARQQKSRRIRLHPDWHYDRDEGVLYREEKPLHLSQRERRFLDTLLDAPAHLLQSAAIKALLWPSEATTDDAVRVFINRFRHKTHKELIRNRPGVGYYVEVLGD